MPQLNLTLSPVAVPKFYDAISCLAKFSESVVFEARRNKLVLSTFNSTKSAYGAISLHGGKFFDVYHFVPSPSVRGTPSNGEDGKFVCQFHVKALLPIFRSRFSESKDRETNIEKCEMIIREKPDIAQCRLVVKLYCKNGVLKTYRLQYEEVQPMHALFNPALATSKWKINSKLLREYMDHFGPKADHLDIYAEDGRASFTSFTEKLVNGNEVLKHPLQTSVQLDTQEFELFEVEEQLHVAINVKDFRAVVVHADSLTVTITALYSENGRPMQITYDREGLACEFTLMSRRKDSDNPASSSTKSTPYSRALATNAPAGSNASANGRSQSFVARRTDSMPPPPTRSVVSSRDRAKEREDSPPIKQSRSFFIGADDDDLFGTADDNRPQDEDEEDEDGFTDLLRWDASEHPKETSIRESTTFEKPPTFHEKEDGPIIPPTQRPSQRYQGLFGED